MSVTLREYLSDLAEDADITEMKEYLNPMGIKVVYETSVPAKGEGRMMFSTQRYRNNTDFQEPIVQECGGVVVEYGTWDILAFPPYPCNPRCRLSKVDASEYDIRQIGDGTTVTLYFYENEWHISTLNGYSVGPLVWTGNKTYQEILDECLEDTVFCYENLETNKCYTIGFRHPDYHPFNPKKETWFIQSVDLNDDELVPNYDEDIGIPLQTKVDLTMDELKDNVDKADTDFIKTGTINFGYVLRKPELGPFSNILIESSLMKQVKSFVYNDKEGRLNPRAEGYIGPENRMRYIAMKAYLDYNSHHIFIKLFPQYANVYKKVEKFLNKLAKGVLNPKKDIPYEIFIQNRIRPHLINKHKLRIHSKIRQDVVLDLITTVYFLEEFYDELYGEE